LIHVYERIEVGEIDTGECAAHREPFALESARRGGDHANRPLASRHRVRRGQPRQHGDVGNGDRWHDVLPVVSR
jgi:hypothetical protein